MPELAQTVDVPAVVARLYGELTENHKIGILDCTPKTNNEKNATYTLLLNSTSRFAQVLIAQIKQNKYLSPKQWYWAIKLAGETIGLNDQDAVQLDFAAMIAMFDKAASHLKYPKIRLQTKDGQEVCLSRAGSRSRYCGTISVTDGARDYDHRQFFGRIRLNGRFDRYHACTDNIVELLRRFSDDPVTVAAEYGKLTGNCCFCRRSLTDSRSTAVGYGPICASNFGLTWG